MPNTDTIIFSMASRITAQFPNITVKDAMTLATIAMDEFSSHNTTNKRTSKATKPKDPTKPKRTKNGFMYYLDSVRAELKAQLLAEAQAKDPSVTTIRVSEVTSLAGVKWKALDDTAKTPFQKMADDAKAAAIAAVSPTLDTPSLTLAADSNAVDTATAAATQDSPTSISAVPPTAPIST